MPTRKYWDAVGEQTVTISGEIEKIHAAPNKIKGIEYTGSKVDAEADGVFFSFDLYTTWHTKLPYKMTIFFDKEVIMTKGIPMIATKMNRQIAEETTRMLTDIGIVNLNDYTKVRKEVHQYVTGFDITLLNTPVPKEREPDLRTYVFLRFILSLPIIPEENLHSIYVMQEAMEAQKRILKDADYIKSLQDEHYKKYGNLAEKAKVYLTNFFK